MSIWLNVIKIQFFRFSEREKRSLQFASLRFSNLFFSFDSPTHLFDRVSATSYATLNLFGCQTKIDLFFRYFIILLLRFRCSFSTRFKHWNGARGKCTALSLSIILIFKFDFSVWRIAMRRSSKSTSFRFACSILRKVWECWRYVSSLLNRKVNENVRNKCETHETEIEKEREGSREVWKGDNPNWNVSDHGSMDESNEKTWRNRKCEDNCLLCQKLLIECDTIHQTTVKTMRHFSGRWKNRNQKRIWFLFSPREWTRITSILIDNQNQFFLYIFFWLRYILPVFCVRLSYDCDIKATREQCIECSHVLDIRTKVFDCLDMNGNLFSVLFSFCLPFSGFILDKKKRIKNVNRKWWKRRTNIQFIEHQLFNLPETRKDSAQQLEWDLRFLISLKIASHPKSYHFEWKRFLFFIFIPIFDQCLSMNTRCLVANWIVNNSISSSHWKSPDINGTSHKRMATSENVDCYVVERIMNEMKWNETTMTPSVQYHQMCNAIRIN